MEIPNRMTWKEGLTAVALYAVFFCLYTTSIDLGGNNIRTWNFVFDTDTRRIVDVFIGHEVTDVHRHPLYALFFKAPARWIHRQLNDPWNSARLVTTSIGALAIPFAFLTMRRFFFDRARPVLFTALFGLFSSVWLLNALPETFSMNLAMIVLAFWLQGRRVKADAAAMARFHLVFVAAMVVAVGISLHNVVYFSLALASFHRKRPGGFAPKAGWTAAAAAAFIVAFTFLSLWQRDLYPQAYTFASLDDYLGVFRLDRQYLSAASGGVNPAWLWTVLVTFLSDGLVAPTVVVGTLVDYGYRWSILTFSSPAISHLIVAALYAAALAGVLRYRRSATLLRNPEAQLAMAFVAFNLLFHSHYRGLGLPLIYSVHVTFPLVVLLALAIESVPLPVARQRLGLAVLVAAVGINNLFFMRKVDHLGQRAKISVPVRTR